MLRIESVDAIMVEFVFSLSTINKYKKIVFLLFLLNLKIFEIKTYL